MKVSIPLFSAAVVEKVKNYVMSDPAVLADRSRFIEGWGWDHTIWPIGETPSYVRYEHFCLGLAH